MIELPRPRVRVPRPEPLSVVRPLCALAVLTLALPTVAQLPHAVGAALVACSLGLALYLATPVLKLGGERVREGHELPCFLALLHGLVSAGSQPLDALRRLAKHFPTLGRRLRVRAARELADVEVAVRDDRKLFPLVRALRVGDIGYIEAEARAAAEEAKAMWRELGKLSLYAEGASLALPYVGVLSALTLGYLAQHNPRLVAATWEPSIGALDWLAWSSVTLMLCLEAILLCRFVALVPWPVVLSRKAFSACLTISLLLLAAFPLAPQLALVATSVALTALYSFAAWPADFEHDLFWLSSLPLSPEEGLRLVRSRRPKLAKFLAASGAWEAASVKLQAVSTYAVLSGGLSPPESRGSLRRLLKILAYYFAFAALIPAFRFPSLLFFGVDIPFNARWSLVPFCALASARVFNACLTTRLSRTEVIVTIALALALSAALPQLAYSVYRLYELGQALARWFMAWFQPLSFSYL